MGANELEYDVVVVGAGNAALCAALSAREHGARVLVLEKAPRAAQGGNCPYTRGGFRFVHGGVEDVRGLVPDLTDDVRAKLDMAPYTAQDFRDHLLAVTRGEADPELMDTLISQSRATLEWMHSKGVRWELPSGVRTSPGASSVIPNSVGLSAWRSGPGLLEMLTTAARRNGIDILYETAMQGLLLDDRRGACGVQARDADGPHLIRSRAVVLACGGFEASPEMRSKHLGAGWERGKVRGSRYNTGDGHRAALDVGARPFGQWSGCHATPVDANAPDTGRLDVADRMPRRSYPLGVMVNLRGRRFIDEGAGFAEQTFVKVGGLILTQDRGIAFQIFDSKAVPLLEPRYGASRPVEANSVSGLAEKLHVDPTQLSATLDAFNREAHEGEYNLRDLDGRSTKSLTPPKSNWAIKIDAPPFVAFTVTGAITYTYGGLRISTQAQVLDMEDKPISGLFAAGEIVGGIFYHNSLRGAGLMHGAVFGRLAGVGAANRER
jgi:tricarballylate dehydrogenase